MAYNMILNRIEDFTVYKVLQDTPYHALNGEIWAYIVNALGEYPCNILHSSYCC